MKRHCFDLFMLPFELAGLARARRQAWAQAHPGGRGLEVGAGTGANVAHYPDGALVVATDASPDMLAGVRRREGGDRLAVVACKAEALPFRPGTFDWVTETLVFCEIGNVEAATREVARVLRPGGRFILLEHVRPRGLLGAAADLLTRATAPLWGEHFNRNPVPALRATGFSVREIPLWLDVLVLYICTR